MLNFRQLLTVCVALYAFNATSQRGSIITSASTTVMDPNGDGYVSLDTDGFSNDGYYLDEFEFQMFALPIFGDGDALNDTQAGPNCGSTDLTVDSEGQAAYAVLDDDNNLIFRLRLAAENPAVKAYTILIDTDGAIGSSDDNFNTSNLGFEIDITLIKSNSKGILVYDIDGATGCPTEVLQYDLSSNFQLSIADEVSCGDEDYFYDFFLPFGDLTTEFGITVNSELQFAVLTNISATCALGGSVSDIGGVNDDDYSGCIECAFEDLASNQCPVPFSELQDGGGGFASGSTPEPELETPLKEGDTVISGKAAPEADVYIDVYDINDALVESDTSQVDTDSLWSVTLTLPLSQGDSVVAVAEIPGNCDSQASGSQVSFAVVVLNTKPTIGGTAAALAYTENDGAVPADPGVVASDNEDLDFVYATIQISNGYESTEDILSFTDQLGLTGSYDAGSATMTITGDASVDDYNTAIQSVSYSNSSEDPVESTRTVTFIINDGTEDSDPFTRDIIVSAVNDAPAIAGTSGSTEYPASPPLNVNSTMSISDLDDTQLTGATVSIVLSLDDSFVDGDELQFSNTASITGSYNASTGILTLSGTASLSDYATALNSIDYEYNPPGTADYDTRKVNFSVTDGTTPSSAFTHFITFAADVNLPPDVVDENGDPIVDGIDVTTNEDSTVEVCLEVSDPDGDLVTIDNITTPSNGDITITGDLCFEYTPDPDFSGTESITVTVCDAVGNCDATPVDITITIDEVNDPPLVAPSTESADEKTTTELCIDPGNITDIEGDTHEFTSGTSANGGTVEDGTADDLCFDYTPPADFIGTDQVEVTICDSNDPTVCSTTTVDVEVVDVNDSPIIYVKGIDSETMTVETFEDSVKVFCFSVVDVDGDNVSTKSIVKVSGNGTLIADATEFCYEYTPVPDENGIPSVWEITIEDDGTGNLTDMVTVTLNIQAVNDYPTLNTITDPTAIDEDAAEQSVNLSGISAGGGETQTLTVTATSDNTGLIANPTVNYTPSGATGSLDYTPVANQSGTATITVTVDDGQAANNTVSKTFTVTVNAVNDQPTLADIADPTAIDEDAGEQTVNISGISAGGGETQTLTVTATSDNTSLIPNPTVTYSSADATGSLAYTPVSDQSGTATITVTVDDGQAANNTVSKTFTVTVDPVNDQPTLADIADPTAIDEDAGEQTVNLSGISAGGGETQTLSVTATSDNTGLIPNQTVNYTPSGATGSLDYTPVANQSGTATITVTVDDGQAANNTVSKTFTVTVNAVNDQPTLADITDPAAIDEDAGEQTVNLSGISAGGGETQTLSVTATSDNTSLIPNPTVNYTPSGATGSLDYIPVANQSGTATITVTVDDGQAANNTVSKTFTVTVDPVNDQPTLADIADPTAIDEDAGEQTVNISGISAGGGETQTLSVTATSDNTSLIPNPTVNYTPSGATGSLDYIPVANQSGTATITVTVDDGQAANNTVSKTFTVTVDPVNDQPTLADIADPTAIDEDAGEQTVNLSGISAGGGETQTLSVTATSDNTGLIPNPTVTYSSADVTGSLAYTPVSDQSGTATITVTVDDGQAANNTVSKTFTVTVDPVNDQPTLADIADPTAIDEDAGEQTVNISGISAGGGETQTLSVTATSDNTSLIPNPTVNYTPSGATGSLDYIPVANQSGTATITVTVDDGQAANNTVSKTFTVTVDPVNDQPTLADIADPTAIDEDAGEQTVNLSGISAGGGETQTLSVTATSDNTGLIPNPTVTYSSADVTGSLAYTPVSDQSGTATITVTVDDGQAANNTVSKTFTVTVDPVNDQPTLADIADPTAIDEDAGEQTVNISGISAGGGETQTLSVTATSDNTSLIPNPTVNYTPSGATGSLDYIPVANQSGTATITVTVDDGQAANNTVSKTFTVTVDPVNDQPTLADIADPTAIDEDAGEQTVNLSGISAGGGETQTLSVTATSDNTGLIPNPTVTYSSADVTGSLAYTPVSDQSGTATITVTVDDGQAANNTVSKTFTVTVNAVNDQPTLADIADPAAIDEDAAEQTVNLSGISAGGGETQTLTVTATSDNTSLIPNPTVNYTPSGATGSLDYTPVANQSGTATITVTVDDGQAANNTVSKTFTVTVNAANDQPTLADIADPTAIDEDAGEQTVNLSGISAGGGETQTLTVTATSDNTGLIPNPTVTYISDDATGSLAYTPVSDQSGTATITVTVDDGQAANNTVSKTFTVTVNAVNDQPTLADISDPTAIDEDAGEQTVNISGISAGGGETQTLSVTATSDNTSLIPNPTVNYTPSGATGSLDYTPVANQSGTATITVTVDDGQAANNTVSKTFTVTVNAVNDQPTLADIADPTAIDEDAGEQTVNLSGISAGGGETQTLSVTATSDNTGLIPNPTVTYSSADVTGSLAYTPVSDQSGTATITVTVDDGQAANNTVSKTFTVTVNAANDQPTLADIADPTAIDEDATEQTVNLSGISAGGGETQTLSVTATSDNTGLIPNPTVTYSSDDATGSLAYTSVSDQSGTATITVTVDDGQAANNTVTKTFTVTVDPVNDAPIIDTQTLRAVEKETTTLCITASDIEGDTHQFVSGTSSNGATITNSSSADMCFQYSPADDFIGIDQVEVTICDANAPSVCTTSTINVEVLDVNDSPIFTENGVEVNSITIDALEDTPLDLCLEYTDPEGHNVSTIRLTNLSGSGILTENSTTLCYTYAPEENMNGTSVWQVDVQDDGTPPATATVFININIANVNDAPETRPDTLIVMRKESKSTNVLFNDFDLDGDDLRLRTILEKQPVGGTATVSPDGTITYFSDANFRGTDSLIYIVEDLGSPSLTAFGKMIIRINDNPFTIYQTVSPNGDGMNDYWHIEGIDFYPNNKVSLFDRYNNLVFEIDGYNNEDKVWIGNSNKGSNNTLPEGTYFYRINAGEAGTFGGFVVLRGTQN